MKILEINLTNKMVYDIEEIINLGEKVIDNGLQAINIHPEYTEYLLYLEKYCKVKLSLDLPYSRNELGAKVLMTEYYLSKYSDVIDTINFGITYLSIDKGTLKDEMIGISNICKIYDVKSRLFLTYELMENQEECYRIANMAEQAGVDEIILGNKTRKYSNEDVVLDAISLKNNCSIPVGISTWIENMDLLENLMDSGLSAVLVHPENILNLNRQTGV